MVLFVNMTPFFSLLLGTLEGNFYGFECFKDIAIIIYYVTKLFIVNLILLDQTPFDFCFIGLYLSWSHLLVHMAFSLTVFQILTGL